MSMSMAMCAIVQRRIQFPSSYDFQEFGSGSIAYSLATKGFPADDGDARSWPLRVSLDQSEITRSSIAAAVHVKYGIAIAHSHVEHIRPLHSLGDASILYYQLDMGSAWDEFVGYQQQLDARCVQLLREGRTRDISAHVISLFQGGTQKQYGTLEFSKGAATPLNHLFPLIRRLFNLLGMSDAAIDELAAPYAPGGHSQHFNLEAVQVAAQLAAHHAGFAELLVPRPYVEMFGTVVAVTPSHKDPEQLRALAAPIGMVAKDNVAWMFVPMHLLQRIESAHQRVEFTFVFVRVLKYDYNKNEPGGSSDSKKGVVSARAVMQMESEQELGPGCGFDFRRCVPAECRVQVVQTRVGKREVSALHACNIFFYLEADGARLDRLVGGVCRGTALGVEVLGANRETLKLTVQEQRLELIDDQPLAEWFGQAEHCSHKMTPLILLQRLSGVADFDMAPVLNQVPWLRDDQPQKDRVATMLQHFDPIDM